MGSIGSSEQRKAMWRIVRVPANRHILLPMTICATLYSQFCGYSQAQSKARLNPGARSRKAVMVESFQEHFENFYDGTNFWRLHPST
ncbi:hypothetical protein RRG08_020933 [Elysia crispata]|uniref:Uncharacterized protein n=1 Tax=Elysia crispata TaxID=231223 RepID=A0AAE1AAB9_9GAST|nr:hypothetical protein RRG08_020933 [Elysia crispata]